jgi:hypothetical protein
MTQVQLPPQFQSHPECAAGIVTIDQAIEMINRGWLTYEGARWMFPPKVWVLLPQEPGLDKTELFRENHDSRPLPRKRRFGFGWLLDRSHSDRQTRPPRRS